jgi:hypothetical protein
MIAGKAESKHSIGIGIYLGKFGPLWRWSLLGIFLVNNIKSANVDLPGI